MPKFSDIDALQWREQLRRLRTSLGQALTLEQAAQILSRQLFMAFSADTALVRVYAALPYEELEPVARRFVDAAVGEVDKRAPKMPVLALMGTHGSQPAWCDRTHSHGHLAIPLISEAFVQDIPMVARLLKELGVELMGLDAAPEINARRLLGGFNGVFYVEDAAAARDAKGRLIIPAQDFVAQHKIKTVFGMGGVFPDNTLVTIIVFCTETLRRDQVERLKSLVSVFKGEASRLVLGRKFFGAA